MISFNTDDVGTLPYKKYPWKLWLDGNVHYVPVQDTASAQRIRTRLHQITKTRGLVGLTRLHQGHFQERYYCVLALGAQPPKTCQGTTPLEGALKEPFDPCPYIEVSPEF